MRFLNRLWIVLLAVSTPLSFVSLATTYGPWNGSDYGAYLNAILCESNRTNICDLSDGETVLGFDEKSSAFIATAEPQLRTESVFLYLPSKLYSQSLSFIVTADLTQATVLIIAFIAGLCSVLLFLSIGMVQRSKRRTLLLVVCMSLAMPGFSHLLATPYPIGIATFALLLYVFSTMKFLSYQAYKNILLSLLQLWQSR